MTNTYRILAALLVIIFTLISCSITTTKQTTIQTESSAENAAKQLNSLLSDYFKETLEMNPVYATFVGVNEYDAKFSKAINNKNLADALAFEKKYLVAIRAIDSNVLSGQDLLSYQIFERDRVLAIEREKFPTHLIPIDQMGGAHSYFAMLGSGASAQPFNTEADYHNFLKRADGFAEYMDSVITAMREGARKGVVLPKPIVTKLLPQLNTHLVEDVTKSVFYGPVLALGEKSEIEESVKPRLKAAYTKKIREVIIPAYRRVYDYINTEYKNKARGTIGLSALPDGQAWYEYQIKTNTTLPLSAQEIHEFGKSEVARILAEMKNVKQEVGFNGDLAAFFDHLRSDDQFYFESEQEIIDAYESIKEKINARIGLLFEVFPKADYEVRAVEGYRAASAAGASYQRPAPDGSRPGIFYINTHDLKAQPKFLMETLSIHEAAPGHHFQISIQQEVEGLPEFRKFGGYTVFAEGWALYAESLGKEMGLFTDPYMWYGRLADEQLRAMRLVVDTGIHAFGWSREQAIEFMLANSSMATSDVVAEVERYISIPGQALAYKTGERHIRMLRNLASERLGDAFNVKKFHTQVLIDGALPMPILESKILAWIESEKYMK